MIVVLVVCSSTANAQTKTTLYSSEKEKIETVVKNYLYSCICGDYDAIKNLQTYDLTKLTDRNGGERWVRKKDDRFDAIRNSITRGYWPIITDITAFYAPDDAMANLGIKKGDRYVKVIFSMQKHIGVKPVEPYCVIYLTKHGSNWKVCRI